MRHRRNQLALGLFDEDHPPPYPAEPSAITVSVSGGLDSDYAALWARQQWPEAQIILWHAYLPLMDWDETLDHLHTLAATLGNCRLVVCQAVYELNGTSTPSGCNGTSLRRCHIVRDGDRWYGDAPDDDPAAMLTLLDFAVKARNGQPPTRSNRWCTSYFKTRLFDTWARQHRAMLGDQAVLLSGERWAESEQRSQVPAWEWRDAITLQPGNKDWPDGWKMLWARPGIDKALHEVASAVLAAGITPHFGYVAQGEKLHNLLDPHRDEAGRARLSCRVCIFSQQYHIQHALDTQPHAMLPALNAVLDYEQTTGFTWQQRGPLTVTCTI
jgi:hypothetical protein